MKRILIITIPVMLFVILALGVSPSVAAKPQKAIEMSNGMPSGDHETLLFHGKNESFLCSECDPSIEECNVVNIPEYGTAPIIYVSGRKVNISTLKVFDSCAGFESEEDSGEIWLPYEPDGYYVFARALGKPAKGDPNAEGYEPRSIIFQNAESNNPTVYSLFGDVTGPGDIPVMMPLGLITQNGAFKLVSSGEGNLVRFDSAPEGKGRGKTIGKEITDMFMWSGCVYQPILDVNQDGVVDESDVEACCLEDYDADQSGDIDQTEFQVWLDNNTTGYVFPTTPSLDVNQDGVVNESDVEACCLEDYDADQSGDIDQTEFLLWASERLPDGTIITNFLVPLWACYDQPVWVFTIADLVYQNQVVINEGIKNLQIRFYPVATTEFTSQ